MELALSTRWRLVIVLLMSLATVSFHYGWIVRPTGREMDIFHAIHGRLCYIPIILGAIWFGVRGGLAVAIFIIILTLPYSFVGHGSKAGLTHELTEMVFYLAIGLTAGILIELQRGERKRREALSRELARQEHLSSLGQMAAGLAHEIKNPLGSIRGSVDVLSDDAPADSKRQELLQILSKETTRLNGVVEEFLSFARPPSLKKRPVQINDLLHEVASQIAVDSRARNVTIEKQLDPGLSIGAFDAEKLHQVFLNIALNAVGAMPDGGMLRIESRDRMIGGRRHVTVTFDDEGKGIADEDLDKIFDPFFTKTEKGTGLGLSISHMIVQHHGGRIDIGRNGGGGARVTIVLPIEKG